MLPLHLLVPILCKAGAWRARGHTVSAWSVCKEWRNAVWGSMPHLAAMLIATHGPEHALVKAARASRLVMGDRCLLLQQLLLTARADCLDGAALLMAALHGHADVVLLLLDWPQHAPHADCHDGEALILAASRGHGAVVILLLQQPQHAPRADCQDGRALVAAAMGGHAGVVRLLLGWPVHAPRANCQEGRALLVAAGGGHEEVVRILQQWPQHAPQASSICNQVAKLFVPAAALCGVGYGWLAMVGIALAAVGLVMWWEHHAWRGATRGHDLALARTAAAGYWNLALRVLRQRNLLRVRLWYALLVATLVAHVILGQLNRFNRAWQETHQQCAEPAAVETAFRTVASLLMATCTVTPILCLIGARYIDWWL